jgi:phage terminase large subunit
VNEGNELKFIEWQQLQMRTTEFSIIDYNPSFTEDHWLCTLNKEKTTYHFITTYKDNPFLEQKVIDEIESLQWKNPSLWRVYGLGLQAIIEGLIFENVEYVDEIPLYAKKRAWIGMDLGYTNDPTAIVEVCLYDDTIYIDEVCYQTKMLSSDITGVIKEKNRKEKRQYKVISESADPRLIDEVYNAGVDIHPVKKFGGSIMAGIQKMQEFKIKVTKRSTNIRKEFNNYTYRQDKEGKWLNEPIDAWNHGLDAIRYVILEEVLGGYGQGLSAEELADIL